MSKKGFRVLGILLFILGVALILNTLRSMTGFAIIEEIGVYTGSIAGLVLLVLGVALLSYSAGNEYRDRNSQLQRMMGRERYKSLSDKEKQTYNSAYRRHLEKKEHGGQKESRLAEQANQLNIIRTEHFERAIQGHEKAIERAIKKIGTGKGKEEKLSNGTGFSMRVTKGGRMFYERNGNTYKLTGYTEDHKY